MTGIYADELLPPLARLVEAVHRYVLANDKIVAVLRQDSPDIDLYARRGRGVKLCARLQPLSDGTAGLPRTSLAIKANSPDAVSLELGFRSPRGETRRITYEFRHTYGHKCL